MGIRLVIDKGPLSGTVLILENGTSWSLGSDGKASDILLQDEKLAPSQIRITLKDGEYYLENLDASRPVSADGTVITAPVLLKDGVSFVMGSCQVSFFKGEEVEGDIELSFQTEGGNEGEPAAQGSSSVSSEAPKKETGNPSLPSEAKASGEVSSSAIAKEQELAASFLASVEKEPGTPKEVSEPKVSSQEGQTPSVTGEKKDLELPLASQEQPKQTTPSGSGEPTQSQNASMEENRTSPDQNQQPQLSSASESGSQSPENQEQQPSQTPPPSPETPEPSGEPNSATEENSPSPMEKASVTEEGSSGTSEEEKEGEEDTAESAENEDRKSVV